MIHHQSVFTHFMTSLPTHGNIYGYKEWYYYLDVYVTEVAQDPYGGGILIVPVLFWFLKMDS